MAKTAKKIIQILSSIRDKIDSLSISNHDEWSSVCGDLKDVIGNLPKHAASLFSILSLCLKGIEKMAADQDGHSLALIEAVAEALTAADDYLKKKKNRDMLISAAAEALEKVLNSEPNQEVCEPQITINDAATLLIQLEPDDPSGLERLGELLEKLIGDASYPESSQKCLLLAVEKINALKAANRSADLADFTEIGALIEDSMNMLEKAPEPDPEVLPAADVPEANDNPEHLTMPILTRK